VRYSAVTDVKLLFYRGTAHAAGSCEDAIHYSSTQLTYQNVGNKSRRFSNKVKCLLAECSKFFFVPFNGVCNSLRINFHGQNEISSIPKIYVRAVLPLTILNIYRCRNITKSFSLLMLVAVRSK
jgi:hypothetical protein